MNFGDPTMKEAMRLAYKFGSVADASGLDGRAVLIASALFMGSGVVSAPMQYQVTREEAREAAVAVLDQFLDQLPDTDTLEGFAGEHQDEITEANLNAEQEITASFRRRKN
jgi:hypothetical protein